MSTNQINISEALELLKTIERVLKDEAVRHSENLTASPSLKSSRTARHSLNIATNTWNKKKKKC